MTFVLVPRGQRDGRLAIPTVMMADFLPSLQQHCIRANCMLHVTPAYFRNDVPVFSDSLLSLLDSPSMFDGILGFVYFTDNLAAFDNRHMLTRMADTGKPIALVDNEDKGGELIAAASRRNIVAYTFAAGSRAGYLTGKHLIAEGHRHAAYITSRDGISWSENRFAGLQRAFNAYNIDKNGAGFSIASLELYNPSPDPRRGGDVKIVRIDASGGRPDSMEVSLNGKSRPEAVRVDLGWSACKAVELTCRTQFSIDNVVLDNGAAIGFEDMTGEAPVQDRHFDCWDPAGKVRDMGLCPQFNSHIIIEGGVKWYSVRNHGGGDGLLNPRCGRTRIRNNDAPVHIYNFHDQHSAQDGSIILENARYVSIYGLKTEQTNSLMRCYNSNNIRVFGMGNTTNHVVGHAYVHLDNCTDYVTAVVFDRLLCDRGVAWCSPDCFGRICFVARQLCEVTHPVEEVVDGSFATTAPMERPVLLKRGSPGDPFEWGGAGVRDNGRFGSESPPGSKPGHRGLEIRARGTDGALRIALTKPGDSDALLRVTDLSGREVWQRRIRGSANACVVSPTLGAGAYVVSLEAGTGRRVSKVIAR